MGKKFGDAKRGYVGTPFEIVGEYYLDDDTYVVIFNDMIDKDGDTYHLEVEYHFDEKRFTFTNVYENETINSRLGNLIVGNEIKEYILKKIGIVKHNLTKMTIEIEMTLDVDDIVTIKEINKWKDTIKLNYSDTDKIKVIDAKLK